MLTLPTTYNFQPDHVWRGLEWLQPNARTMSTYICGGKGSGKSTIASREMLWKDMLQGVGTVLLDPVGGTVDHFLAQYLLYSKRLTIEAQAKLLKRIRYFDLSGRYGHVPGFPLIYRRSTESCFEISQRFVDIIRRTDNSLADAPIMGLNSIFTLCSHTLSFLAAFEGFFQLTELEALLRWQKNGTERWKELKAIAVDRYPELAEAVNYLETDFGKLRAADRNRVGGSLFTKLLQYNLDPTMRCIIGASEQTVPWEDMVNQGLIVLIDLRHVADEERKKFLMMHLFRSVLEFSHLRGRSTSHRRFSFVIDELAAMVRPDAKPGKDPFAQDLNRFINEIARNNGVMLTCMLQEAWQAPVDVRNSLRSCGNYIQGVSSHTDSAIENARFLFPYDPQVAKSKQPIYAGNPPQIIDYRPVPFTTLEWELFAAQANLKLPPFKFLVRGSQREGDFRAPVGMMSGLHLTETFQDMDEDEVAELREQQAIIAAPPMTATLKQIADRQHDPMAMLAEWTAQRQAAEMNQPANFDTLGDYEQPQKIDSGDLSEPSSAEPDGGKNAKIDGKPITSVEPAEPVFGD